MFSGLYNFVKRHRRKIFVAGVVVTGVTAAARYACYKFDQWKEQQAKSYFEQLKKQQHFERTQHTCIKTVKGVCTKMKNIMKISVDADVVLHKLKNSPDNRIELWEELKVLTFAGVFLEICSSSLLVILSRLQFALLGGYMYIDSQKDDGSDSFIKVATSHIQQEYLALVNYFLDNGLQKLEEVIKKKVLDKMSPISLKEKLTVTEIQEYMLGFKDAVFVQTDDGRNHEFLQQILIPDAMPGIKPGSNLRDDLILAKLLNETKDAMENHEFQQLCVSVVDIVIGKFLDHLLNCMESSSDQVDKEEFINPASMSLPLAKIIPLVNGLSKFQNVGIIDEYIDEAVRYEPLQVFAANVYEAFSIDNVAN